jgi:invasion protein IalB
MAHSIARRPWLVTGGLVLFAMVSACGAMAETAKPAGGTVSWVKLCDQPDTSTSKKVCSTIHDTIDANTGLVVVSAAIRETEGAAKRILQIIVPSGMILAAGARMSVLSASQAETLKSGREIDKKDVKEISLKYTTCSDTHCTAEVEAPQETLDVMKAGAAILVRSIYTNGKPFNVPVPLNGFATVLAGKPTDNVQYKKARDAMMQQIKKRKAEKGANN